MQCGRRFFLRLAAILPFGTGADGRSPALASKKADDSQFIQTNAALIRSRSQHEIISESRRIAPLLSDVIESIGRNLKDGQTTAEVNRQLMNALGPHGLAAAMLGHDGFPAASAVSVDHILLHAPPDETVLRAGSTVTIELSASSSAAYAAQGWTFPVGCVSPEKARLMEAGRSALEAGIATVRDGVTTHDIGEALETVVRAAGYHVIQDFCGYTMGQERIQKPNILNFKSGPAVALPVGTIINIYLSLKSGTKGLRMLPPDFRAVSMRDGEYGAVATAMVVVEKGGSSLLTRLLGDSLASCPA
jgi:methionyl aminopeptidase